MRDTVQADFISTPDFLAMLSFPATTVSFFDQTFGASQLLWDFGDGIFGEGSQPVHTYTPARRVHGHAHRLERRRLPEPGQPRPLHRPRHSDLFIPNVFSPNDDGLNDIFLLNYTGSQPLTLRVYDRWGISSSTPPTNHRLGRQKC
ncbi:MAG: gliding motility-associated C-terminal domain-containing protein [Bacteroidia bacterium]